MESDTCGARTERYLCQSCEATLRQTGTQLPWLANQLALTYSRQNNLTPAPPAARRRPPTEDEEESPLPYIGRARDAYDEIRTVLGRWARDLSEQLGVDVRVSHPARTVELCAWLAAHVDRLACSPDAALALDELTTVAWRRLETIDRPLPPIYRGRVRQSWAPCRTAHRRCVGAAVRSPHRAGGEQSPSVPTSWCACDAAPPTTLGHSNRSCSPSCPST
ncbi:hypothetical protein [Gordonia liuliyuniae]|uniref:Uncharacterized protein n=1 Tax=Gordonia liuliyuniae TaxID=2911517 RepID=A0ABS9IS54_9ACTN|nr:hypothetical protein [Gordonia liuliyuniae]MCF8588395.1 hypothetical protein [Gordonia liuliyuniae]